MKRSYLSEIYFSYNNYMTTYNNNSDELSWDIMRVDALEPTITPHIIKRENYEK